MKIYLAEYAPGRIGGGWTFMRNFHDALLGMVTDNYDEADIYFIASPSMVQRDQVEKAKKDGKKIVLRIDNAVRNSRNRNTGMTRMKDFADSADLIIFQSEWALEYLRPFLAAGNRNHDFDKPVAVILNGINLNEYGKAFKPGHDVLYSRFNRDETKNWEVARYWYSQYQLKHPEAKLHIVGQFSDELRAGNFDFYNGENYEYYGVLDARSMARLYNICPKFLYTYYNDACSNSLIEALVSCSDIVGDSYYRNTGGAAEIMANYGKHGREYFGLQRMANEYIKRLESL
jgi:hypothetical protein